MSDALACLEMGNVFLAEGNHPAAADAFKRAVEIDPLFAHSYFCQANLEREQGKQREALANYNKAIDLDDSVGDFYNNRGLLQYEMGNPEAAETEFQKAISIDPERALFLNNLGVLYQCLNQLEHAEEQFLKAISVDPIYASSYYNLGIVYSVQGDEAKALEYYDLALSCIPDWPEVYNAKCLSLLLLGRYQEGWDLHEWRWKTKYKPFPNGLPDGKLWNGEDSLLGKTILIQSEQGFGDILQFCRYLPMVDNLGAKIIFRTENALIELMQSLRIDMECIPMNAQTPKVDYYCPILSLPWIFKTTLENIPNSSKDAEPYLFADPVKVSHWKNKMSQHSSTNKLRVGLVWSGAPRPQRLSFRGLNSRRDIPLATFTPLLQQDVEFYSLQVGAPAQSQLHDLETRLRSKITDWTHELKGFSDTAALIENLDLVVSVDTSIVHLAGALGKPVYLLNRKDTCWRWLSSGEESPWYPSVTVFRQSEMLRWDDVIQNVILRMRTLMPYKIRS